MIWEYRTEYRDGRFIPDFKLEEWGSNGWEVCSVFSGGDGLTVILKRPIPEESDETEAYDMLLTYAECDEAWINECGLNWKDTVEVCRKHGYTGRADGTKLLEWLTELREKALKAARAVDRPHAPQ